MAHSDRRSRDQKRKQKLKKRAERGSRPESLAYHGSKYKKAAYVPFLMNTETGIHESSVMTDRLLTDDQVERALTHLIHQLRKGPSTPVDAGANAALANGQEEDLVIMNIKRNWLLYAEAGVPLSRDDQIGVLRTILSSLENWRSEKMHPRGYLQFLEGFMKKAGITTRRLSPEEAAELLGTDFDDDDDDDEN